MFDQSKDGALDVEEFALAMHICGRVASGEPVPQPPLPPNLVPPSQRPQPKNPFS